MDRNDPLADTGLMDQTQQAAKPHYTVLSRHTTSDGIVVWVRCDRCLRASMLLRPLAPSGTPIAAGHHEYRCPQCS